MEFKTAAELGEKIDGYFADCEETERPPAVSDLALALGFDKRLDFLRYKGKPSYKKLIERALLKIEGYSERRLFDRGCYSGAKYSLSNNFKGWSDKPDNSGEEAHEKLDEILRGISKAAREN
ncbi:MAG: DNA-packaging protein [Oscillospiraceae bacterium]|nr:DNA-packaging protein [Oscillospiraceae bacterium]